MNVTTRSASAANDSIGPDGPTLVITELLCYASSCAMLPVDNICSAVLHLYRAEAIREVKVKLCEWYSSTMRKMECRRDGPIKKAHITECEDILRAFNGIDAKFCQNRPLQFVAQYIRNMPAVAPGEFDTQSILNRICKLEREIASINTTRSNASSVLSTSNPPFATSGPSGSSGLTTQAGPSDPTGLPGLSGSPAQAKDGTSARQITPTDLQDALPPEDDDGFSLSPREKRTKRRQT